MIKRCGCFLILVMKAVIVSMISVIMVVLRDEKALRKLAKSKHGSLQSDKKTHDCKQDRC